MITTSVTLSRHRLSSAQREALYERCRGTAEFPCCNIPWCGRPVRPGERWVESHFPVPHALGGTETGVAHEACNAFYAAQVEVPAIAKAKRVHRRHIGAHVARHPLPCGRNSRFKKTMDGRVVARTPKRPRFVPPNDDAAIDALTDQLLAGSIDETLFLLEASVLGADDADAADRVRLARVHREMRT